MPTRRQLIQKITLNANSSSVTISNIPQNYTDLQLRVSSRCDFADLRVYGALRFNNDGGNNYSTRTLWGTGTNTFSSTSSTNFSFVLESTGANATASTFGNNNIYIPNYTGSSLKSSSSNGVSEHNGTNSYIYQNAMLWSSTSPITSITFFPGGGANFVANSTFYLYGITHVPIIRGGTITVPGDGFKYHTFRSSGSLQVIEPGEAEYLVVAGGGGGGYSRGGGGGAGGFQYGRYRPTSGTHSITIGSGGSGGVNANNQTAGSNSSIGGTLTSIGGGQGGSSNGGTGGAGGSGGGGAETGLGGAATSGQGNVGGNGTANGGGGGGGGVNGAGTNGTSTTPGPGGAGRQVFGAFYAGGGGGGVDAIKGTSGASGGIGGGATGSNSTIVPNNATPNTGGGGGGGGRTSSPSAEGNGSNGGSGIVIIRYPYDGN